jgi:hypothetical protein
VFGDLLWFLGLAAAEPACCRGRERDCSKRQRRDPTPACFNATRHLGGADVLGHRLACPCDGDEVVTAVSPLYPNPWRKKSWGPFRPFG